MHYGVVLADEGLTNPSVMLRLLMRILMFHLFIALFSQISELTKKVREEIYKLLVEEFKYFE
jgi:hypothetical protein